MKIFGSLWKQRIRKHQIFHCLFFHCPLCLWYTGGKILLQSTFIFNQIPTNFKFSFYKILNFLLLGSVTNTILIINFKILFIPFPKSISGTQSSLFPNPKNTSNTKLLSYQAHVPTVSIFKLQYQFYFLIILWQEIAIFSNKIQTNRSVWCHFLFIVLSYFLLLCYTALLKSKEKEKWSNTEEHLINKKKHGGRGMTIKWQCHVSKRDIQQLTFNLHWQWISSRHLPKSSGQLHFWQFDNKITSNQFNHYYSSTMLNVSLYELRSINIGSLPGDLEKIG